jgi:hypothetical protein
MDRVEQDRGPGGLPSGVGPSRSLEIDFPEVVDDFDAFLRLSKASGGPRVGFRVRPWAAIACQFDV